MSKCVLIEDTYQQKLKNTTNLRLLAFFIWKLIIMATISISLNYILNLDFVKGQNWKFFLGFNPSEIITGKNFFFKIYITSIILDWLRIIYYQKYEESLSKLDYFFKLFFLPSYNTIFFILNFMLTTMFLALFENAFNSKRLKNEKIDVLSLCFEYHNLIFGFINTLIFIFNKRENFDWPELHINRTDSFKFELSKSLNPKFKSIFSNLITYSFVRFAFRKESLNREFIVYYILYELLVNFSYRNLKRWISYPINPLCKKEYHIISDLLSNDFNIDRNQRFLNNHFLQNIYYVLENCLHNKLLKIGSKTYSSVYKQEEFLSNENMDNLRNFFEFIVKNFKKENDNIQTGISLKQKGSASLKNLIMPNKDPNAEKIKTANGNQKEKFLFTEILEKLIINEYIDVFSGFSNLFCVNITINIMSCYIKILALECNEIIEYNSQTLHSMIIGNIRKPHQNELALDETEKRKIKLIKYLLSLIIELENQVKRLETFPNFRNLIKTNSLDKEFNKFKCNLDFTIRLLLKDNLSLMYLEGPEIDKIFENKMKMLSIKYNYC